MEWYWVVVGLAVCACASAVIVTLMAERIVNKMQQLGDVERMLFGGFRFMIEVRRMLFVLVIVEVFMTSCVWVVAR